MASNLSIAASPKLEMIRSYPKELLGTSEIHKVVPHIPVDEVGSIPLDASSRIGMRSLAVLVSRCGGSGVRLLDLVPDGKGSMPDKLGRSLDLGMGIGRFVINLESEEKSTDIDIFTPAGEQIPFDDERIAIVLAERLVQLVDRAEDKYSLWKINQISNRLASQKMAA